MSPLPPCKNVLRLHVLRSVYIAALWTKETISKAVILDLQFFGWNKNGSMT